MTRRDLPSSAGRSVLLFALAYAGCGTPATPHDAATAREDVGVDAAPPVDVGPIDAAPDGPCPATYAGCTTLEDHTGETAITLMFSGFAYTPHCIRISAGTTVTIPGSSLHPLHGATCSAEGSPLPTTPTPSNGDYTFDSAGAYGYYCNNHGTNAGGGMAGLIVVE
jgi:plastocyanin